MMDTSENKVLPGIEPCACCKVDIDPSDSRFFRGTASDLVTADIVCTGCTNCIKGQGCRKGARTLLVFKMSQFRSQLTDQARIIREKSSEFFMLARGNPSEEVYEEVKALKALLKTVSLELGVEMDKIVHLLENGTTPCGVDLPVAEWPRNHAWDRRWSNVNCVECLSHPSAPKVPEV